MKPLRVFLVVAARDIHRRELLIVERARGAPAATDHVALVEPQLTSTVDQLLGLRNAAWMKSISGENQKPL